MTGIWEWPTQINSVDQCVSYKKSALGDISEGDQLLKDPPSVNTKDRSERPCRTEADLDLMVAVGGWWWSWWMVLQATARLLERLHAEEAANMEALVRRRSFAKIGRLWIDRMSPTGQATSKTPQSATEDGCRDVINRMLLSWITKRYG